MSKVQVDAIEQQCGSTLTVGGGASKTVTVDATTVTLGRCGGTVTLASGATQSGFGRTGTVDWQTSSIKTATFTAANGEGYFANTSGGAFTMNLPAGTAGNIVSVVDYTNTFQTNALTVAPNGSEKIGGIAASIALSTEGQSVTFVYVDATEGWKNVQDSTSNVTGNPNLVATGGTVTTSGDYKIHKFTGPGTFTVSAVSQTPANNTVSYMVVAGGGGGGATVGACQVGNAGGGAGGFREYKGPADCYTASPLNGNPGGTAITVTAQGYPITVGAGGTSPNSPPLDGGDGSPSVFSSITSTGGGGGADESTQNGSPGGSGGGASYTGSVGNGNTPPVSPAQGQNGGLAQYSAGPTAVAAAGGGGGATAVGAAATPSAAGAGGAGATTCITASPVAYAGGGGGGTFNNNGTVGAGGTGGGGAGVKNNAPPANSGTVNTGGGGGGTGGKAGGGGNSFAGGSGGSGIVVIRYKYQ